MVGREEPHNKFSGAAQNSGRARVPLPVAFPTRTYPTSRPTIINRAKSRLFLSKIQPRRALCFVCLVYGLPSARVNLPVIVGHRKNRLNEFSLPRRLVFFSSMLRRTDCSFVAKIRAINYSCMLEERRCFISLSLWRLVCHIHDSWRYSVC